MYEWEAIPGAPVHQAGVHDDRKHAVQVAAEALLATPEAIAVLVTEVWPPARLNAAYFPTGRTWTGRRDRGKVAWTAARALPEELAS
jgi:hypothetical protein